MIRFTLGAALMCAPGVVRSQEHPVTWKLSPPAQSGASLVAKLDATIEEGWHLYSQTQPAGGPVPTSIAVAGTRYSLSAKPRAPEPDHIPDRNFNIISEVYSDSVRFSLPLHRAGTARDSLRISVRYQACTNRVCMPPRTDTLIVSGTSHPQAPSAKGVKSASDAAALLRKLVMNHQFNDGASVGAELVQRYPRDTRVRAWYVENLIPAGRGMAADSLTAKTDTASHDPWLLVARAACLQRSPSTTKSKIALAGRLARRAGNYAPRDPDIAWFITRTMLGFMYPGNNRFEDMLAFVDSAGPTMGNPIELQVMRATALLGLSSPLPMSMQASNTPPDTAKRAAGLRAYAAAHAADTTNFDALYDYSARLRLTQPDLSLTLAKQATLVSPRSGNARSLYWNTVNAMRTMTAAQKRAVIAADRADYLTRTDSAPWALADVATSMRIPSPEPGLTAIEDRILAVAPRSRWAENVLATRVGRWRDSLFASRDTTRPAPRPDSIVAKKQFVAASEAYLDKGWVADSSVYSLAAFGLFYYMREDTTFSNDQLIASTKRLAPGRSDVVRALAARKLDLPRAEQLARENAKNAIKNLEEEPAAIFSSVGDKANSMDRAQAESFDDLGLVLYTQGRYDEADKELGRALDLDKKSTAIYYDLGRLRTAQGRYDEAELTFAQGMTLRPRGVNPNRKELEQLYTQKHGSMEGWTTYIAALEQKERDARRTRVLATQLADAKVRPSFHLPDLSARVVDSDSLKGRYLVVHFWGTWCGPCVAEMPDLQQFYDKYKGDPNVDIITISNDKDLQDLKDWVAKRKMTIPTLFDDGWVNNTAQIQAFPTTWFIDRDGKMQFSAIGNTGALVEEWGWRLEAMRAKPVAVP